jgi:mannose-6-phosphate isomerase-like protein (cupin superfamily)
MWRRSDREPHIKGKGIMKTMKIINIDDISGRHIDTPGMTRTIKDILATDKMTTHWAAVPPGQSTSEHSHPLSEEIVYIVKGAGRCRVGEQIGELRPNCMLFVPEGVPHQFTSTGNEDLIIFVVYSPPAEVPKK